MSGQFKINGKKIPRGKALSSVKKLRDKRDNALKKAWSATVLVAATEYTKLMKNRTSVDRQDTYRKRLGRLTKGYAESINTPPTNVTLKRSGEFLNALRIKRKSQFTYWVGWKDKRMRQRAIGLAQGRWPVWGRPMRRSRPKRRIMGIENSQDQKFIYKKSENQFWKTIRKYLKFK